jgi:plastocyanin
VKIAVFSLAIPILIGWSAHAASLAVTVKDRDGAPLEDAVAWAVAKPGATPRARAGAAVQQIDKTFVPLVSVVQAGTLVRFPNRDDIRHHVYSFSPAKVFEIKLYAGTPAEPVLFDKPGEVVLGCNIHDHMIAYIYVVDTPHFAKSGRDGVARMEGLAPGDYDVHVWHYAQAARVDSQALRLRGEEAAAAAFAVTPKPMPPRLPPK